MACGSRTAWRWPRFRAGRRARCARAHRGQLTGQSHVSLPRRGAPAGVRRHPAPPVRFGFRVVGKRFLRSYPYEEAFFLPYARQFLAVLSTPLVLLGGITERATIESALSEGFAFVAMARALLREPDLPNRMRNGSRVGLVVHPLQQVHADHLFGHPLRPGEGVTEEGVVRRGPTLVMPSDGLRRRLENAIGWRRERGEVNMHRRLTFAACGAGSAHRRCSSWDWAAKQGQAGRARFR